MNTIQFYTVEPLWGSRWRWDTFTPDCTYGLFGVELNLAGVRWFFGLPKTGRFSAERGKMPVGYFGSICAIHGVPLSHAVNKP
ncbi:MAG: hypothetical protein WC987_03255 [Mariniphaga sp.]